VPQPYGNIVPGANVSYPFSFTAVSSNIGTIKATLLVRYGSGATNTVTFNFQMPNAVTFTNDTAIVIPDKGTASVYPSVIDVSGISGYVKKVTATLNGFSHTYPHDVSVLLVNPSGQASILMSHASLDNGLTNGEKITLTFDSDASQVIPASSRLTTGAYQPAQYAPTVAFTNAPAGPYMADMSIFGGVDPNGEWKLYVLDDSNGDSGKIYSGWSLAITTVTPVNPVADLAITGSVSTNQVLIGDTVTYSYTVANNGPADASAVLFSNTLPSGVAFISSTATGVTSDQTFVANLGSLAVGSEITLNIQGRVTTSGVFTSEAFVASSEIDLGMANNKSEQVVYGVLPTADIAIAITNHPTVINTDSQLRYTVLVTNFGPNAANAVVVTSPIPTGVAFVSSIVSQGTCYITNTATGSNIVALLGDIPGGEIARVYVTMQPSAAGTITTIVSATTTSTDPESGNNSASFQTDVVVPGPIIVADGARLIAESGPANGAIDDNETVTVEFRLSNTGTRAASAVTATLQSTGGVVTGSAVDYGTIGVGSSVTRAFTFTAKRENLSVLVATLSLTDGSQILEPVTYQFQFSTQNSFANSTGIVIPDSGPALLYPSAIDVSGLAGSVSKVSVTLYGITHSFPRDINILLVSPDNVKSVVFSHVGGATAISNVTLSVSQAATDSFTATSPIVAGTYLPTRLGAAVAYPNVSVSGANTSFDVFSGSNPNGTWALYVIDDSPGDSGYIAGGWSIDIETVKTVNPAADLAVALQAPAHANTSSYVTNTITVQNNGPNEASHVVVTNTLPTGSALVSVLSLQGTCNTNIPGLVTCDFGTVAAGNGGSVTVVFLAPAVSSQATLMATVVSDAYDAISANNQAIQTMLITLPMDSKLVATYIKSSNTLNLTVVGQPEHGYNIESSTDLTNWTVVNTITLGSDGTGSLNVTPSATAPHQFYRASRLP
jgi:uncharacterized repeat protein (TIGR01451 family)